MPGGRPSKFDDKARKSVELLAKKGITDAEMSTGLGITEQTLNNWKQEDPAFFESIKDWRLEADRAVERSLYERACGYTCPETKAQWVNDEHGGRWEYAETRKHYPPDPTSMIFWLKNRQPKKWRDKVEGRMVVEMPAMNVYRDPPPTPEGDDNDTQEPTGEPTD